MQTHKNPSVLIRLCGGHLFLFLIFVAQHLFLLCNTFLIYVWECFPLAVWSFGGEIKWSSCSQQKLEGFMQSPSAKYLSCPALPTTKPAGWAVLYSNCEQ